MIVKQYIKDFEQLGFGMFIHFGLYSMMECGEYFLFTRHLSFLGPMGDGGVRPIDPAMFGILGEWVRYYEEAIRKPLPCGIEIENKKKRTLY